GRPAEVIDPKRFLICPPTGLGPAWPRADQSLLALSQRRFFANSFFLRAKVISDLSNGTGPRNICRKAVFEEGRSLKMVGLKTGKHMKSIAQRMVLSAAILTAGV